MHKFQIFLRGSAPRPSKPTAKAREPTCRSLGGHLPKSRGPPVACQPASSTGRAHRTCCDAVAVISLWQHTFPRESDMPMTYIHPAPPPPPSPPPCTVASAPLNDCLQINTFFSKCEDYYYMDSQYCVPSSLTLPEGCRKRPLLCEYFAPGVAKAHCIPSDLELPEQCRYKQ